MLKTLLLFVALGLAGRAAPSPPGLLAKTCELGGCGYLVVRNRHVHYLLQFTNGQIGQDVDMGTYLESAKALVPKHEAPVRELRSQNGWKIIVSAFLDGSADALHVRMVGRGGKTPYTLQTEPFLPYLRAGPLFGGTDQFVAIGDSGGHAYVVSWWVFLLPDSGAPRLVGQGTGAVKGLRSGSLEPGITIQRQHTVDDDANRVLTVTEYWIWSPQFKTLILGPH